MKDEINQLVEELAKLAYRKHHHDEEDCFYSCPLSGHCCNDKKKNKCDCGADEHNEKVDNIMKQWSEKKVQKLKMKSTLERIASESQGLRLRYFHEDLGETTPPFISEIALASIDK